LVSCSTATPWAGERVSGRPAFSLFASCFSVISTGMTSNRVLEPTFPGIQVGCGAMIAPWGVLGKRYVAHRVCCGRSNPRRGGESLASRHRATGVHNAKKEAVGGCVRAATSCLWTLTFTSPYRQRHPQRQRRPATNRFGSRLHHQRERRRSVIHHISEAIRLRTSEGRFGSWAALLRGAPNVGSTFSTGHHVNPTCEPTPA
jgi:hypothetical protein